MQPPVAYIDFETYSEAGYIFDNTSLKWKSIASSPPHGLGAVGSTVYAEHPSTEVLCLAYAFEGDRRTRLWVPGMLPPQQLFDHISTGGLLEAWNVAFEIDVWNQVCVPRMGWPSVAPEQWRDTMARSYAHSLPGSLKAAAIAIDAPVKKQTQGTRLINFFSKPRNPTKKNLTIRNLPKNNPQDAALLYEYCIDDVRTLMCMSDAIPQLSPDELELWHLDQRINRRGVHVDTKALADCKSIIEQAFKKYTDELITLTNGAVTSGGEIKSILSWLTANGVSLPDLQKATVVTALKHKDLPPVPRQVLEIRKVLGSQSVKKLYAIDRRITSTGRLTNLFAFCGADRTCRWAGRGPQAHNLPNSGPRSPWTIKDVVEALQIISNRNLQLVEAEYEDAVKTVSGCLRGLFCAILGSDLICSDFSAIEAVVLAELAGETWRQEVFRTHGKIYETSASKITGVPLDEMLEHRTCTGDHHSLRKLGKVAELASGYKGWIGAWLNFGADKHFSTEAEIRDAILAWRAESPNIVEFWGGQVRELTPPGTPWRDRLFNHEYYGVEGAAIQAVLTPGTFYRYRRVTFGVVDDILYCQLPSGRNLTYHQPRLTPVTDRYSGETIYQLSFMGFNSDYKKGPRGWMRLITDGGKLVANITQAVARDRLVHSMLLLDAAGYKIVLHVHDEVVCEIPCDTGSIEEVERLMEINPPWCAGWPIRAASGWRGKRFRKD